MKQRQLKAEEAYQADMQRKMDTLVKLKADITMNRVRNGDLLNLKAFFILMTNIFILFYLIMNIVELFFILSQTSLRTEIF
jgi:hypothetical protein